MTDIDPGAPPRHPAGERVTGDGVPLTTTERVAKYGARTRPAITGGVPLFELDESLDAKYRESVLIRYEDLDREANKALRDRRSWLWFMLLGTAVIAAVTVLALTGVVATSVAFTAGVPAAVAVIVGFPYRRLEHRKHQRIVGRANEYLQPFVTTGKARVVEG